MTPNNNKKKNHQPQKRTNGSGKEVKHMTTQDNIENVMDEVKEFLLSKNIQYGDSVFNPVRVFSKVDKDEQLKVRIDDKLSRLMRGNDSMEADEDIVKDLIGYLALLLIAMRSNSQ